MIPDRVKELVEQFREHRDSYKSTEFKEAALQQQFINPFWEALGWDMSNRQGLAETYKEVIVQDRVRIDDRIKAPDYVFRAGSEKKFFLEVKAPKVNLATDPAPAYQLKRYAWTAGLSISLLSDFEEFAVYQTTAVPKPTDAPFKDRIEFFGYEQYEEKWDWLWDNFSREAIWKGRFDKYAAQAKGKRGTTPFDKAFLADMHDWRKRLAENIALRNKNISEAELNFAVQVTLDRIIMLRICEDRKIEQYGNLALDAGLQDILGLKKEKITGVYKNLLNRFAQADDRFNSGLFHFKKEKGRDHFDALTPQLAIDDKVLTDIIKHLYYPESPYAFDIVPSDILGHVYEKFLGQVITLTKGGNARVEDKPEVKKAGGVYYTPTYIVDYIVKNTVGPLLGVDRVSTRSLPALKILDPACGSGSFLLGAYQYLLDWYLRYYHENNPLSWAKKKVLDAIPTADPNKKEYHLSIAERKRILLEHIHGVDIDSSAVEVAKLNLMLKVLEGGEQSGVKSEHRIAYDVSERLLPDLDKNIVCGNSLIGLDYFDEEKNPLLFKEGAGGGQAERAKINAMNWRDAFPVIMKRGGFDVVIGNPPYVRIQTMQEWAPNVVEFYKTKYRAAKSGNYDLYVVFVERALSLLNSNGQMGFILPSKFINAEYGGGLRAMLAEAGSVRHLIVFGDQQVFENATTYTSLLFLSGSPNAKVSFSKVSNLNDWRQDQKELETTIIHSRQLRDNGWNVAIGKVESVAERLASSFCKLGEISERIFQGLVTGADQVFLLHKTKTNRFYSQATDKEYPLEGSLLHPLLKGSLDMKRYHLDEPDRVILFPYSFDKGKAELITEKAFIRSFPKTWNYLLENRQLLEAREKGKWKHSRWYALGRSQNLNEMDQAKILTPSIANRSSFSYDESGQYYFVGSGGGGGGGYGITIKPEENLSPDFLIAILNSKLCDIIIKSTSSPFSGGYYAYNKQYIEKIPIPTRQSGLSNSQHDKISDLSKKMRQLLSKASGSVQDHTLLDRQIAATDREIDRLVYALYGLTEEEIKIVEGE